MKHKGLPAGMEVSGPTRASHLVVDGVKVIDEPVEGKANKSTRTTRKPNPTPVGEEATARIRKLMNAKPMHTQHFG